MFLIERTLMSRTLILNIVNTFFPILLMLVPSSLPKNWQNSRTRPQCLILWIN